MRYLLLCFAVFLPGSLAFPARLNIGSQNNPGFEIVKAYLDKFFPINPKSRSLTLEERIKEMQKFFHLTITGKLDAETEETIKKPRCGVPDVADYQTFPGSPKWKKTHLTYRILNYTPDLPQNKVDDAIRRAFTVWSNVTPLQFQRVYQQEADIEIAFARRGLSETCSSLNNQIQDLNLSREFAEYFLSLASRIYNLAAIIGLLSTIEHGDGYPFDGRGNTLAHAFPPGDGIGGDTHFDDDERWSEYNREVNLFLVAAHEFGHSLGLAHSNVPEALMYPVYKYVNPATFRLPDDDKRGIQKLYGKKSSNS